MRSNSMSTGYYQALLDRCWRRSGSLLYRPNPRETCCPHYTLRLDASQFRATKDQRQAINRLNKYVVGDAYAKEVTRLYPRSREETKKRDVEFDLLERIHEAEDQCLKRPPQPAHTFVVTLEPDVFTEEKYAVFENYQRVVHHETDDSISKKGFERFLCSSPLQRDTVKSPDGKERQVGSFHQCYRLDGKLVAVGVLDLLPNCVSAVYMFYHESIHKWQPGKLSALREIALAAEQGYQYWYSGYYIHTCPKMKYKMDYSPQYVLDPATSAWVQVDKNLLDSFDSHGYLHFSAPRGAAGPDQRAEEAPVRGRAETHDGNDKEDKVIDVSMFESNMPGIPTLEQMQSVDLDHIPVRLNRGFCFAGGLFDWSDDRIGDKRSPKTAIAEMVAAIGPDLLPQTCLDFRRD